MNLMVYLRFMPDVSTMPDGLGKYKGNCKIDR